MLQAVDAMWHMVEPAVPWVITLLVLWIALTVPLPGRGPSGRRDPWRSFKYGARREVMERAGARCERHLLLLWGRCGKPATDADHIYPWSKGGPTIVSNGQALCRTHNARKGSRIPAWWLILGLERRRTAYFPEGADPRVVARRSCQPRR